MGSILRSYMTRAEHTYAIVGDTKMSFTDFDHHGWLKCDGRSLPIANYGSLHKVIGTTFGGSGSQFKLPDMRGRVAAAAGSGAERDDANRLLSARSKGQYIGEEVHQLTIAELAAHNHGVAEGGQVAGNNRTNSEGAHDHGGATSGLIGDQNVANGIETVGLSVIGGPQVGSGEGAHNHSISTDGTHYHTLNGAGNDIPHNNMQPTLILGNMFIYCNKVYEGAGHYSAGTDII
jgi:microcystin-dependent protein